MTNSRRDTPTRRLTACIAALTVLLAPLAVSAQPVDTVAQARQHFQNGKQRFDAGDYRGAIQEFETANELAPAPLLHFNIGLAYERLGEAAPALEHFKLYLQKMPDAPNRSLVEVKVARLESEVLGARQPDAQPGTGSAGMVTDIDVGPPTGEPGPAQPAPAAPMPAPAGSAQAPAPAGAPMPQVAPVAATGDPQLDRVAAIDVAAIRDQRAPLMAAPEAPVVVVDEPSKPAHKQVWFWIVVGVSALILLDVVAGGDEVSAQPGDAAAPAAGPTLLRF